MRDAVEWHAMVLVLVGAGEDQGVQLADQVVDAGLQRTDTLLVLVSKGCSRLLHEGVHV